MVSFTICSTLSLLTVPIVSSLDCTVTVYFSCGISSNTALTVMFLVTLPSSGIPVQSLNRYPDFAVAVIFSVPTVNSFPLLEIIVSFAIFSTLPLLTVPIVSLFDFTVTVYFSCGGCGADSNTAVTVIFPVTFPFLGIPVQSLNRYPDFGFAITTSLPTVSWFLFAVILVPSSTFGTLACVSSPMVLSLTLRSTL